MKKINFFILFILPLFSLAQTAERIKVITLHPSVGKSIDVNEKREFYLFPDYNDSIFESAEILKYNDSIYFIRFKTTNGKEFEKPTNTNELDQMFAKVESRKPRDYVESNDEKETRRRQVHNHNEAIGLHIGNVILQVLLITLTILAQASY